MMWTSVGDFLAMGGHGLYVWSSYGAALLLVLFELFRLKQGHGNLKKRLLRRLAAGLEVEATHEEKK